MSACQSRGQRSSRYSSRLTKRGLPAGGHFFSAMGFTAHAGWNALPLNTPADSHREYCLQAGRVQAGASTVLGHLCKP